MRKFINFKTTGINSLILFIIICLSLAYFWPQLEGKILSQSDITHYKGMSKEISDFRKSTGEEPLWTNSMFGGMPAYMISTRYPGNITSYFQGYLRRFFHPAAMLILYILGFYILLRSLSIAKWQSLVGAIAYGFSSYYLIIIGAGHNTKAYAIGYMAIIIAGILMTLRGKKFLGFILFTISFSLQLQAHHLQITYYTLLLVILLGIVEFIYAFKEKSLFSFFKNISILLLGVILALGMNFSRLYTAWEYGEQTNRGPSELTNDSDNKTSGLDKDYVVQWSYGIDETLTLLIPNIKGGGSQINPGVESESYKTLKSKGVRNLRQNIRAVSMYHGDQPSTAGPVYAGSIVVFLFVFGLFIVKGRYKWWLLSATVVSIIMSWGGNIMWFTSFLLDYLPLYNKFRAPSMILILAQFAIPLLGFIGLSKILNGEINKRKFIHALKWTILITGGVTLLFGIFPGLIGDFSNPSDSVRFPEWLIESVITDRKNMLSSDAFRSLFFVLLASVLIYAWYKRKIKTNVFIFLLGLFILADMWTVDKRYLNNDSFNSKRENSTPFTEAFVDKEILKDKDLNYRVLPLQNPFTDARASYFHKNVGGYHAAKLGRYQELIEHILQFEIRSLINGFKSKTSPSIVYSKLPALNMLNTRYFIFDLSLAPLRNTMSLGNAWFVHDYKIVESADQEIAMMKGFNSKTTAIVDNRFEKLISNKTFSKDKNGSIVLTDYKPNYLRYSYAATSEQLTVFSEIYYNKGWKAFIDGKETQHFRVNYVLRAMVIPKGSHTIEFKFEPRSYFLGNKISYVSSLLLLLVIASYVFIEFRKRKLWNSEKEVLGKS